MASLYVAALFAHGADGTLAYNEPTGRARWLEWLSTHVDLPGGFPGFFRGRGAGNSSAVIRTNLIWPAALWMVTLLGGGTLFVWIDTRIKSSPSLRALTAPSCLALLFALGVTISWRVTGSVRVLTTASQIEMLRREDSRLRPIGLQLGVPTRLMPADAVPSRLAIGTSRVDDVPPDTLLFVTDVPPGSYGLHLAWRETVGAVSGESFGLGHLTLGIGRATLPVARWSLWPRGSPLTNRALSAESNGAYRFDLPILASSVVVSGDEDAVRSIERVSLVPLRRAKRGPVAAPLMPASSRLMRARDAARFGSTVVYALDDQISLKTDGFWVFGDGHPDVLFFKDEKTVSLDLQAINGAIANRLRVRRGDWSSERVLAPGERWLLSVPVASPSWAERALIVTFDVQPSAPRADADPTSRGPELLGCLISVR
jgi:hypothetical protein